MSRFSRLEPLTYTEKNRLICRSLNKMNQEIKQRYASLDSDLSSKPK